MKQEIIDAKVTYRGKYFFVLEIVTRGDNDIWRSSHVFTLHGERLGGGSKMLDDDTPAVEEVIREAEDTIDCAFQDCYSKTYYEVLAEAWRKYRDVKKMENQNG